LNVSKNIDRFGTVGLFFTAIFSPCCFPVFSLIASSFGFASSFELFGGWTMWIFQFFAIVSLIGAVISYRQHHNIMPVLVGLAGIGLIFYAYHFENGTNWQTTMYIGMFGLLASTGLNYYVNHRGPINQINLESEISCPHCGHKKREIMPSDSCLYLYECEKCKTNIKPLEGDCCVYCSYGTVKCPPVQSGMSCC
jgi:hypothetical protein